MTANRRIFLNIVATYGRSLYSLVIGLFCGRWTLMALGEIDYGLNGLIGGLTYFLTFINIALSGSISRFYAFSIGQVETSADKTIAVEECRHWFNIALFIHTVIPLILVCIGYPIGVCAVTKWLTIPVDRVCDCVCVLRCVTVSCFVSMASVPFSAMYTAKQYIAELTIYGICSSTINLFFLYYMVTHPGVWLARFSIFTCILSIVPQLIICIRALMVFPECKIRLDYMLDRKRISKIGSFAGWHLYGMLCSMLRTQGISIVINKFFGAAMNAAQTIGNTVQGHCTTLSGAMQGAFIPVITQACGAKNYERMNKFAIMVCKFNVFGSLIFMLPLAIELPEVLKLWLKTPPEYAAGLCYCAMALYLVGSCTMGHIVVVNAMGKIALFHAVLYSIDIFTVPLAVFVGFMTHNVYAVMWSVVLIMSINSFGRVFFARAYAGTSIRAWLFESMIPMFVVTLVSGLIGLYVSTLFNPSFIRVCITTLTVEILFIPLSWFYVLSNEEREFVSGKFVFLRKLRKGAK